MKFWGWGAVVADGGEMPRVRGQSGEKAKEGGDVF